MKIAKLIQSTTLGMALALLTCAHLYADIRSSTQSNIESQDRNLQNQGAGTAYPAYYPSYVAPDADFMPGDKEENDIYKANQHRDNAKPNPQNSTPSQKNNNNSQNNNGTVAPAAWYPGYAAPDADFMPGDKEENNIYKANNHPDP